MLPLITIIMPIYNAEKSLEKSINCILKQTYNNVELICIDDGSSDSSFSIAQQKALEDKRVSIIKQENRGVSSARNIGIKNSKGDYLAFVDSDDYIEPSFIEKMYINIIEFGCDISCSNILYEYENDKRKKIIGRKSKKLFSTDVTNGLFERKYYGGYLCNKLYKSSLIKDNDIFLNEKIFMQEDLLFNYYIFNKAKTVIYDGGIYYHYIINSRSACQSCYSSKRLTVLNVYNEIFANKDLPDRTKRLIYRHCLNTTLSLYRKKLENANDYYRIDNFVSDIIKKYKISFFDIELQIKFLMYVIRRKK